MFNIKDKNANEKADKYNYKFLFVLKKQHT